MADRRITEHTALTGAGSATTDLVHVVDVSDTTDAATGTNKKMTLAELATGLISHGSLATDAELAAYVTKALFDAHTILAATTDDTPAALTVAEQTLVGRITSGNIAALTAAQVRTLLALVIGTNVQAWDADLDAVAALAPTNDDVLQRKAGAWTNRTIAQLLTDLNLDATYATDAALSTHESDTTSVHGIADTSAVALTADVVTKALYDAHTVLYATSDNTPVALTMGASTILARLAAGNIVAATPAELRTLLDVPTTGEAVLDALYDAHTVLYATSDNTPAALTVSEETVVGRITGGNIAAINPSSIAQAINTQTDSYTLVIGDAGKIVEMNKGTANTLTVPPNSSVAFPTGTRVDVVQYGAGACTLTPGSGVTIRVNALLTLVTNGAYSGCTLYKRGTNEWVAIGDLVPA